MAVRNYYLVVVVLLLALALGLAGSAGATASTAGLQADPVVTRSYVQEVVDSRLAPLQQEIERAQQRLAALQQRVNNLVP
ncbi:MAG: hypothetical protein PWR22_1611 [Moorella sp. (in: firmicutes)]|jgi:uncharacterized protein YlxW (UPF0749 family)|uniref:hypothetical protein n=1 Tax=unclassified Neomoorella TaxID=2676739 RepID=UPI0010FFBBE2|nr:MULTISPECIES: hypothetical protein [unclassified Moorella (in: firmicutes)]MDK2816982.1 hypothetical protein [Moorella sp. (in: firmicutes)]MDK2895060.1 hypothetical protein [Moorella sp. (in: firmicutes)]GEA14700.1 hypothetical protein E308F_09420 [Moorella sp. E308F]GEA17926.1 hypothetical protein E306M_10600 [Moorella sp. E306M]